MSALLGVFVNNCINLKDQKKSLCGMLELHSVQKIVAPYNPKFAYNHAAILIWMMNQINENHLKAFLIIFTDF